MAAVNGSSKVNGLNGLNGSSSHSPSTSSEGRPIHIIHSESGTKLTIPGIPGDIYGLAADLRDEFIEILKQDGRGASLVPEGSEEEQDERIQRDPFVREVPALLLASYWLDHLAAQHQLTRPILSASRTYFVGRFLSKNPQAGESDVDVHTLCSRLDTGERKAVIGAFVRASSLLDDARDDYGPRGKLWTTAEKLSVYAVFGGQGSNEYYWDEMEVRCAPHLLASCTILQDVAVPPPSSCPSLRTPFFLLPRYRALPFRVLHVHGRGQWCVSPRDGHAGRV